MCSAFATSSSVRNFLHLRDGKPLVIMYLVPIYLLCRLALPIGSAAVLKRECTSLSQLQVREFASYYP